MAIARSLRLCFIGLAMAALPADSALPAASREYQVKAVFLYHFARFVDWPDAAFPDARGPLVLGVLGPDPFGDYLDSAVKGETKAGRPIVVKRLAAGEDARGCQILFIAGNQGPDMQPLLAGLKGSHVLTVGESDSFTRSGGMIRFYTENTRIRFSINLDQVQSADLNISAKLLRLASLTAPGKG